MMKTCGVVARILMSNSSVSRWWKTSICRSPKKPHFRPGRARVCVHVCECVRTHHTYRHTRTHAHAHTRTRTHAHTHTHTHTHTLEDLD